MDDCREYQNNIIYFKERIFVFSQQTFSMKVQNQISKISRFQVKRFRIRFLHNQMKAFLLLTVLQIALGKFRFLLKKGSVYNLNALQEEVNVMKYLSIDDI
jgi:hypothetical protein